MMINLTIKEKKYFGNAPLIYHFYDDVNRIPLEITFDESSKYKEGITIDNYDERNKTFITFRFDKEISILHNITFVSINETNIIHEEFEKNVNDIGGEYEFYVNKFNMRTNYETKLMFDSRNSVLINFENVEPNELNFYSADKNLSLGIDLHNNLKSILLKNLSRDDIKQFLDL